jgi:hypothetical protein
VSPAERRRAWAFGYTSRCPSPPPAYGSPEWCALPDGPEKVAAVVIAAEALVIYDELIDMEMESYRLAAKQGEDAAFRARAAAHRESWTGTGFRPDPAISADIDREWREWAGGDVA